MSNVSALRDEMKQLVATRDSIPSEIRLYAIILAVAGLVMLCASFWWAGTAAWVWIWGAGMVMNIPNWFLTGRRIYYTTKINTLQSLIIMLDE